MTFVSFLFNCKCNWQTEFSEKIIGHSWNSNVTLLLSPRSTHSLHVLHKFYTIPVIVFLVFKPSLYRLNWISWRLRNNRLLWNAYGNLLKHILSKHNRHQYKIMIHRWLCLILCQRKFIFQNNWKVINTNNISTNSFRPFFGYFWQVFIGAYWYKHTILF